MGTSLLAGLLVDKYGVVPAVFLFLSFCFIGQSIWAYGASLESTTSGARFAIMFGGRFIFGMGGGSITIAQNAITAYWFAGRELAMAFGLTLSVARLGSTLNFNLTTFIFQVRNIPAALYKAMDSFATNGVNMTKSYGRRIILCNAILC